MSIKYYVLPEERKQMQEDAIKRAIVSIDGPVGFYEEWPGEGPHLTVTDDALEAWRPFCRLIWKDEARKQRCLKDNQDRAVACTQPKVRVCWLGVHNAVCPVEDEDGGRVTLTGGEFLVRERKAEAREKLEQFLTILPLEQREQFREAWLQIPEISEAEAQRQRMRELELAGRSYLYALKQRSDFRYLADLETHDVAIALQALIADIEVLKIELRDALNIGRRWEQRFEALIRLCEDHSSSLDAKLDLHRPKYAYESINKLIHECISIYQPQAESRVIKFRVDLDREADEEGKHKVLAVRMNRDALRQALLNVLNNAVKYSFTGTADCPRWVEVTGRLEPVRGAPGYSIGISNLGVGIEADELELVFEPGYQGRRRLDEHRSGYGMGLTFVKECVEEHGGSVTISSRLQQRTGWLTILRIWLPLQGPAARK